MSEQTQTVANPYDNMPEGGGLTRRGRVTSAKFVVYPMMRGKDGSGGPVFDKDGKQSYFIGVRIEALRLGDSKNEGKIDKYEFSSGKKGKPSADGEMLVDDKGNPAPIYQSSNWGKAVLGLEKGGFNKSQLYPRISVLVGSEIEFTGLDKKDANGKVKTHVHEGKTYNDIEWFPTGYFGGAGTRPGNGNGAGTTPDELATKAEAAVLAAITAAGGSIERKELTRALATALKGDVDAIKVTTLAAQPSFHEGRPWTVEGTKLSLGA